jgi:hypothetical protein
MAEKVRDEIGLPEKVKAPEATDVQENPVVTAHVEGQEDVTHKNVLAVLKKEEEEDAKLDKQMELAA